MFVQPQSTVSWYMHPCTPPSFSLDAHVHPNNDKFQQLLVSGLHEVNQQENWSP